MLKAFKKHNCTAMIGSPAFLEKMAQYALRHNVDLPLKYTGMGGAPVFRATLRTVSSVTPGKKAAVLYGSTEAEPISLIFAQEKMALEAAASSQPGGRNGGLCVGRPVFKGTVKVIKILEGVCVCVEGVVSG